METLHLLLVEDSDDDALLLVEALRKGGFAPHFRRVETEEAFRSALAEESWELVITDYMLPRFSGLAAIRILQESKRDIPVIMVSGKVGEEHAVEAMRAGAGDYVLKGSLARLAPAVGRELHEARSRQGRRQAEEDLRLLSTALEAAVNGVVITDREGSIIWVNPAFTRLTGYSREEVLGQNPRILKSGRQPLEFYQAMWQTILSGMPWHGQLINRRKDGSFYTEEMTITPVRATGGDITHFVAIKEDVTERRQVEEALRESEQRFRSLFQDNQAVMLLVDPETGQIHGCQSCCVRLLRIPTASVVPDDDLGDQYPAARGSVGRNGAVM